MPLIGYTLRIYEREVAYEYGNIRPGGTNHRSRV
jgi:hypothetical protein